MMDIRTAEPAYATTMKRNPYEPNERPERRWHNPVARIGMSAVELVMWIVVMAALAIGMIWLLWSTSR